MCVCAGQMRMPARACKAYVAIEDATVVPARAWIGAACCLDADVPIYISKKALSMLKARLHPVTFIHIAIALYGKIQTRKPCRKARDSVRVDDVGSMVSDWG